VEAEWWIVVMGAVEEVVAVFGEREEGFKTNKTSHSKK